MACGSSALALAFQGRRSFGRGRPLAMKLPIWPVFVSFLSGSAIPVGKIIIVFKLEQPKFCLDLWFS